MGDWKEHYEEHGYVFPVRAFGAEEARDYRGRLEAAEAEAASRGDDELKALMYMQPSWVLDFVDEISRLPSIVEPVGAILGDDVILWNASLFVKEPRSKSYISWHQDLTYWGLDEAQEVTAWIALSDVTTANGCMKFVAGSHKESIAEHVDTFADDNLLSRGQEIAVEVDEDEAVHVRLNPGEMSLHHGQLIHGSSPNETDDRRIGLALRYIHAGMRQQSEERPYARLITGEDRHGHFDLQDRTRGVLEPADIERARENVRIQNAFLFGGARESVA